MPQLELTRENIVTVARSLIGVKFEHQGRDPEIGIDCIGLVFNCAWACGFGLGFNFKAYHRTPDPAVLLGQMRAWLTEISPERARPGDVILFRVKRDPQHVGIRATWPDGTPSIIHTRNSPPLDHVCEHPIDAAWSRLTLAAFEFPGIK